MVTLNKIYTRTGDDGSTGLIGGSRVKKNNLKVCAYGDVDELNSHIGLCVTIAVQESIDFIRDKLTIIQNELFDLGSELACPSGSVNPSIPQTTADHVTRLEKWIDELNANLLPLQSFVLPGGTILNGQLHISRAVCRRAERTVLTLHDSEPVNSNIRHYLNRLSDLLFVMSRAAAHHAGAKEYLWVPGGGKPREK